MAWREVAGVGDVLLNRLREYFGDLQTAWEATAAELLNVEGIGLLTADRIVQDRRDLHPIELLRAYEQSNPQFWTPSDPDYPPLLQEIPDKPAVLHYLGNPHLLANLATAPGIAIVGTRNPSDYGKRWTHRISKLLSQNNFTILSGLADGIDAIAHQACLEAQGSTIAVLGTGVDQIYPASNRQLYRQILDRGLLLSEYPHGTKPDKAHFPRRNRIVAGLSRAILVMEAGEKSGALITARLGNECGREVYALAGNLDNPQAEGCINLISQGAQIIPKPEKLLTLLGALPGIDYTTLATVQSASAPSSSSASVMASVDLTTLEPMLRTILEMLIEMDGSVPIDCLVQQTQLPTGDVSSALLQLELMGVVHQDPGMRYRVV
nr:DNA-processing protein DprA [Alkalinema sp. FACHB-956]